METIAQLAAAMRWQIDYVTDLLSINRERTMHWARRAAYIQQVRRDVALLAREQKIPRLARCRVVAQPWQKRGPLADHGNHYPTIKAAIDGLVDAHVVPNDTPDLVELVIRAPQKWSHTGLSVVVYSIDESTDPKESDHG